MNNDDPDRLAGPAGSRLPPPPRVSHCVVDDKSPLTKTHIIPDSIGGSWRPKLLCRPCNSGYGGFLEQDIHLDAGLRLAHEHFSWALPAERRWVRDFRRDKQFLAQLDGEELYVRYEPDGRRITSTSPFDGLDNPLDHAMAISDDAAVVMAWLTLAHWAGDDVRQPILEPVRSALQRASRAPGTGLATEINAAVTSFNRSESPLPYHQLQLSITPDGVTVWITLVGFDTYRVRLPIGVPIKPLCLAVVMDLRTGGTGFHLVPPREDPHEPVWLTEWEAEIRRDLARSSPR